jgi:hypothetical protein
MSSKQEPLVAACAHQLYEAIAKALSQSHGIRVEDLISACAAIVGETMIEAAGNFNPRSHNFTPGSRVLSDTVNALFCGDQDLANAPTDSVAGILFAKLKACGFAAADFPVLKDVFTQLVANTGKPAEWGRVPLSIPQVNYPYILPLRVTYETRSMIDNLFEPLGQNSRDRLHATVLTLAEALCVTRDVLSRRIATALAFETVNGMAKTAPMTDEAMANLQAEQKKR